MNKIKLLDGTTKAYKYREQANNSTVAGFKIIKNKY